MQQAIAEARPISKAGSTLSWVLAVLLAVGFTLFGGVKLVNSPAMVQ